MSKLMHLFLFLAAIVALPQVARAEAPPEVRPFAAAAVVTDNELAVQRGSYAPSPGLTRGTFHAIQDGDARASERQTGSIGRVTMDIWWGTIGAELIAANVRALGR